MLADDTAVSNTVLTDDGIVKKLPQRAIHISMSTISVALSKELAQAHARAGQRFVAAPVFGRPEAAAAAQLFIVTAGDPAAVGACQSLFDAMGQKTLSIGTEPSAANLVKLSGNFLLASAIEALGEAVALIGKAGIDRHAYVDLLTSTIFPAPAYKTYGNLIADNEFQPARFAAPLGFKDIRLALAAAESLRVPCPSAVSCATGFCGCSRGVVKTLIGPRSAASRCTTPAPSRLGTEAAARPSARTSVTSRQRPLTGG
jgi:3-hydroxyisobutyrate dehydrogenase-like beta-hydroxyacid dehydrogenase